MNWGRVLPVGCLFILSVVQARVANFSMVYTSDSSWMSHAMSRNMAVPKDVHFLFQSQASPIVLNGSLAQLVIQLFAAQQGTVAEFDSAERAEFDSLHRAVSTCVFATIKAAQDPLDSRIGNLMKQINSLSDENQRLATLAKAMALAHEVLRYAPPAPCKDFKVADGLGRAGWAEFFQMMEHVRAHDWRLFLISNSPQKMVLFVPQAYLARMKAECGNCADAQAIALRIDDANILKPFGSGRNDLVRLLAEIDPKDERSATDVAPSVRSLFRPIDARDRVDFNIYFDGHGSFDERGQALVGLRAQAGMTGSIAGLPAPEFLNMLQSFNELSVKIIMWSTCFGGGRNAQAAAQTLQLSELMRKQLALREGRPYQERRFIAISAAPTDLTTSVAGTLDFGKFFNDMSAIIRGGVEAATNEQISTAVRAIADEPPIILLPTRAGGARALEVAGIGSVAASGARQWQLGAQAPFGTNDLVIDDALVQASSGSIEVPATIKQVLLYNQDIDKPMHIAYDAAHPIGINLTSRTPSDEKVRMQSLIYDGPIDKLLEMLFLNSWLLPFYLSPQNARIDGVRALMQFSTGELHFPNSVQAVALGFPVVAEENITLRNVWFLRYSEKLVQRGWLLFTHQDAVGRVRLYSFEILPTNKFFASDDKERTGAYLREVRDITGDVAFQLKLAQEQVLANVVLQEAAANGEVGIVAAFIKLYQSHGVTHSSLRTVGSGQTRGYRQRLADGPDRVVEQRFEKMGLHTMAPDQFGIDAAYLDAALLENAGALGVLARHATQQIREKAGSLAGAASLRRMEADRIALLQVLQALDQAEIDRRFGNALHTNNGEEIGVLACLASPTQFNDEVFTKIIDKTPSPATIGCALDSGHISQRAINDGFKKIAELAKYSSENAAIVAWWQQRGGVDLQVIIETASAVPAGVGEVLFDDPQFTPQHAQQVLNGILETHRPDVTMLRKLLEADKLNADAIELGLKKAVSDSTPNKSIVRLLSMRPEIAANAQALDALITNYYISDEQERASIAQLLLANGKLSVDAINQGLITAVSGYRLHEPIITLLLGRSEVSANTIVQALIALPKAYGVSNQERLRIAQLMLSNNKLTLQTLNNVAEAWKNSWSVSDDMRAALKVAMAKRSLTVAQPGVAQTTVSYSVKQPAKVQSPENVKQPAKIQSPENVQQPVKVNKKSKAPEIQLKNSQAEFKKLSKLLVDAQKNLAKQKQLLKKANAAGKKNVQVAMVKLNVLIKQLQKKQKNLAAAIKKYTAAMNKAKAQAKKQQANKKKAAAKKSKN